jgi:predicted nucleic acid-binding protein
MSGFLIDTNVLSEYNRPEGPDAGVKRWLETTEGNAQYVSIITLAEIQKGIELLVEGKRRAQLEQWLTQDLEAWFSGRVLPVDRQVAMRWASLVAQGSRTGRPLPTVDSLIAATALAHGLTIVTRNTKDFEGIGAMTLNPLESGMKNESRVLRQFSDGFSAWSITSISTGIRCDFSVNPN